MTYEQYREWCAIRRIPPISREAWEIWVTVESLVRIMK